MLSKMITVLLMSIVLLAHPVIATSMFIADLEELSTGSDMIVQAKVTSVVTQQANGMITTYIRLNIADDLIGSMEDNEIIVAQVGGKYLTTTMQVEGTTTYKAGEDNILFLRKDPLNSAAWQTIGLYQGRYKVYFDSNKVLRVAQQPNGTPTLYKRTADPVETGNDLTLQQFKSKVIGYRSSLK